MHGLSQRVWRRYWAGVRHPYSVLRQRLAELVQPGMTVIDAGCGYTAPALRDLTGCDARLIGVDVVPIEPHLGIEFITADLGSIPLPDGCSDLVYSRSVMEHVFDPDAVYAEIRRLLRPTGRWVFLTPNRWDYVSLAARVIPNRWHGAIVSRLEGRLPSHVFPTAYKTNDGRQIRALARAHGFRIERLDYLTAYPAMFMRWGPAFLAATLYEKLIDKVEALRGLRGSLLVELTRH